MPSQTAPPTRPWVRGVNLGGWLVMERYITPYQFAITECHLRGDFCWYPGQLSAPDKDSPDYQLCDLDKCPPARTNGPFRDTPDFPLDEWTLAQAFDDPQIASDWLDHHLLNFVQKSDLDTLVQAGVTHVRIPIPHFILGNVAQDEPWVPGNRWVHFVRFCHWARSVGIQVWPDVHTAPGSQNGFDNSGEQLQSGVSCKGWSDNATHVERSLQVIRDVTAAAVRDGIDDVVTGFGLINEPFKDCDRKVVNKFMEDGLLVVRETLGADTSVYVSDLFLAKTFNGKGWWTNPVNYNNTYLDSHYYHGTCRYQVSSCIIILLVHLPPPNQPTVSFLLHGFLQSLRKDPEHSVPANTLPTFVRTNGATQPCVVTTSGRTKTSLVRASSAWWVNGVRPTMSCRLPC